MISSLSLLKIQFDAIEGRDKQQAASPILRGSTLMAMVQAATLREGNNVFACGEYHCTKWRLCITANLAANVSCG